MKLKRLLILCTLAACSSMLVQAQVTIGTGAKPARGALLDLKDKQPTAGDNTTASKGLVLPRVKLVNKTTLEPMIPANDPEYIDAVTGAALKNDHVGLQGCVPIATSTVLRMP